MATTKSTEKKKKANAQDLFKNSAGTALRDIMQKAQEAGTPAKKRITITLTENQAKALKMLAEGHGCTVGSLIGNEMLVSYLFYNRDDMNYLTGKDPDLMTQVVVGN